MAVPGEELSGPFAVAFSLRITNPNCAASAISVSQAEIDSIQATICSPIEAELGCAITAIDTGSVLIAGLATFGSAEAAAAGEVVLGGLGLSVTSSTAPPTTTTEMATTTTPQPTATSTLPTTTLTDTSPMCGSPIGSTAQVVLGNASQSSDRIDDGRNVASKAIDGDTNPAFGGLSLTHTKFENRPTWRADAVGIEGEAIEFTVDRVSVYSRIDECCRNRIDGAIVSLYLNGVIVATEVTPSNSWANFTSSASFCGVIADSVQVSLPGTQYLSLAEVEIFENTAEACGKSTARIPLWDAEQSSLFNPINIASKAIDGNKDGRYSVASVSHTQQDEQPFWRAKFAARLLAYTLENVVLYARTDCCTERTNGAEVRLYLNNEIVATAIAPSNSWVTFNSGVSFCGVVCDSVEVILPGEQILSLAEVVVFAKKPTA